MGIKGKKLDPTKTYQSEWVGGKDGNREGRLGCDGNPVVGILGGSGAELDSLGLIQLK